MGTSGLSPCVGLLVSLTALWGCTGGSGGDQNGAGQEAGATWPISGQMGGSYFQPGAPIISITPLSCSVSLVAGNGGEIGMVGVPIPGLQAKFHEAEGMTTDGTSLYIAEHGNAAIRKIDLVSGMVTTLAGWRGYLSTGFVDGVGSSAYFRSPTGITTDGTYLYIADANNHAIRKLDPLTGLVTTLAGALPIATDAYGNTGGIPGYLDGVGTLARFNSPWSITTDGLNLYVADFMNNAIRKIDLTTHNVTTLAGRPPAESNGAPSPSGNTDGQGPLARFSGLYSITTDGVNIYVLGHTLGGVVLRRISIATGLVDSVPLPKIGSLKSYSAINGLATDGSRIYISNNHGRFTNNDGEIVVYDIAQKTVRLLAGNLFSTATSGLCSDMHFQDLAGLALTPDGLYVMDTYRVYKIQ